MQINGFTPSLQPVPRYNGRLNIRYSPSVKMNQIYKFALRAYMQIRGKFVNLHDLYYVFLCANLKDLIGFALV